MLSMCIILEQPVELFTTQVMEIKSLGIRKGGIYFDNEKSHNYLKHHDKLLIINEHY